jgi:hypothetical protein
VRHALRGLDRVARRILARGDERQQRVDGVQRPPAPSALVGRITRSLCGGLRVRELSRDSSRASRPRAREAVHAHGRPRRLAPVGRAARR